MLNGFSKQKGKNICAVHILAFQTPPPKKSTIKVARFSIYVLKSRVFDIHQTKLALYLLEMTSRESI